MSNLRGKPHNFVEFILKLRKLSSTPSLLRVLFSLNHEGINIFSFFLFFKYGCLHVPPITPLNPTYHHLLPLILPPLWFCPCVLYTCSLMTLPLFSPDIPPSSPLVSVSLFFISMSLVYFACLCVLLIRFHL